MKVRIGQVRVWQHHERLVAKRFRTRLADVMPVKTSKHSLAVRRAAYVGSNITGPAQTAASDGVNESRAPIGYCIVYEPRTHGAVEVPKPSHLSDCEVQGTPSDLSHRIHDSIIQIVLEGNLLVIVTRYP